MLAGKCVVGNGDVGGTSWSRHFDAVGTLADFFGGRGSVPKFIWIVTASMEDAGAPMGTSC